MMSEAEVLTEDVDGVRIITLNRPDRLNALADGIMHELAAATAAAARDPAVGCVVVTGAGRGFCSGGDLKGGSARAQVTVDAASGTRVEQGFARLRGHMETSRLLHEMGKPTIAMVNGPVAGAGIGIAGACDLRFAGEAATFLAAFDRIGGSGDFGASWFWTKILGSGAARELMLLGEKLDAATAHAKGIYTKLFPDADLREQTLAVARRLANGPRMGFRYMKANLNMAEDAQFETALDQEALFMNLSTTATAAIYKATRAADRDEGGAAHG
ncbi:enoyl-CoA hydratase-related protein [Sphingomonas sp. IC4-52]|jgi:2-(1,2-epoxy-1,2-dihydrophenyl)acetyl-CoA isomerase|uniref:enoyl-CoA hydratase-related protein n=1 Tax=Sphingomonas sp. IC4-52 TaxID=2887202 RepID=UPI001D10A56D|nr:enoyl-CoA hydratase-related protein [Sphingomonas sp. IC4-52]MCC2980293.1 enoyl-CoA hydratase/isomerase family protein [Sphingomonas sp. IC4-52]